MTELDVYLSGLRAGKLIRKDNGNLQFRYEAGYEGPRLSWALPIQREAHPHSVCRAVFGGLLPEGASREAIARRLGRSEGNDYALLEDLGGDCAGAISLLPAGEVQNGVPLSQVITVEELDEIIDDLPERPLAVGANRKVRLSLAGAQPKLPLILEGGSAMLPLNAAAPTTHIIKPEPSGYPGLVDNEAFCLALAQKAGLTTARASKRLTREGLPYLLVERYDRDLTLEPIRRLHQEDFCQALGLPSDRKYQEDDGPSIQDAVSLIREATAIPARDLPRFWEALVFNWLIGNCDAHAKNYSLLYDSGAPIIAPLYDLVSTAPYEDLTDRLAMSIDGARHLGEVDTRSWEELAKSVGLSARFARSTTSDVIERAIVEASEMVESPPHLNDQAYAIYQGMLERSESVQFD